VSSFVHLHVHSEFSLLDGLSSPKALCKRAAEMGQKALALTDHGCMYAAVSFCQAAAEQGIKPIIGCELYQAPRSMQQREPGVDREAYHLVLLAMNQVGYENLLKLVTLASTEGMYYRPRIDRQTLAEYAEGLICTSACLSGEVPAKLLQGNVDGAREAMGFFRDLFGPDRYFVELQQHDGIPALREINQQLATMAREFGLKCIATNDVHYARKEDAAAQDLLLAIQTQTTLNDPDRMRMSGQDYHLRSYEEMMAALPEYPEAIENTAMVADLCNYTIEQEGYHLPIFEVPEGHTSETFLRQLCEEGLRRHYGEVTPTIRERLEHELSVIHSMGFDDYFLINWDLVKWAKNEAKMLVGPGRGSGPGSLVSYALGITSLEPLGLDLIFERFLNPGRVNMPDIDLDYPEDRRGEVIDYLVRRYGEDKTAQIATFTTLGARAAIRDVGRALGMDLAEVDYVAKLIPEGPKQRIENALETVAELRELHASRRDIRQLLDFAIQVQGVARNFSTHAAGILIADKPLVQYTPLRPAPHGDGLVSQFCMEDVEAIGLLKLDVLGLSTLTVLDRTFRWIERTEGITLDPEGIPLDDPDTYALLCSGDVTGVFQVESEGMRRTLRDMQPSEFRDIIAVIALFRPGPMDYIGSYIDRKYGREEVTYAHPALEPILKDTYGIIVYQEQIIRILTDLAGYSAGEADELRRAVGKKKKDVMLQGHDVFVEGCKQHSNINEDVADAIYNDILFFARYGFNKAHAADYAAVTCQTAFLKAHYPVEYMAALLTVEQHNTEKIGALVTECRKMGIEVLPPDINASRRAFHIEADHQIRFGLAAIKNVGDGPIETILREREAGGPFRDIDDFCRRVDLRQVNKRALECLIKVGAFDRFGQRHLLTAALDRMMAESSRQHRAKEVGQMSMFELLGAEEEAGGDSILRGLSAPAEINRKEMLSWERELAGVYLSSHPLQRLAEDLEDRQITWSGQLGDGLAGQTINFAGMVANVREIITKTNKQMAFVQMEDLQGTIEVVVFPRLYQETKPLWVTDKILFLRAKVEMRDSRPSLLCESAQETLRLAQIAPTEEPAYSQPAARPAGPRLLHVTLRRSGDYQVDIGRLQATLAVLEQSSGPDSFVLHLVGPAQQTDMDFPNVHIQVGPELESRLKEILGAGATRVD